MPNAAIITHTGATVDALSAVVDGYPTTTHKLESTTGGEPLEDGRRVVDHVVAREERLVLEGWVSDFNGGDRPHAAWARLREIHKRIETVHVLTEWGTYPEMIIRRAEATQTGRGMRFTLELEEVIRVGVVSTELPPEQLSGPAEGRSGEVAQGRVSLPEVVDT